MQSDQPSDPEGPPLTKQVTSTGDVFIVTQGNRQWRSGLGECFSDSQSCLCGTCCPLCYASYLYHRVDEDRCMACIGGVLPLRVKVRLMLGIKGTLCKDCCLSFWCPTCVLCQMGRELKSVAWHK